MASIRIRVGAVLDPGATRVFDPLVGAAQRAAKAIASAGKSGAEKYVGTYRSAPAHAKRAFDETTRAAEKAAKDQTRAAEKAAKEQERAAEHVYQVKRRYSEKEERDEARSIQRSLAARQRVISSAARTFGGVVRSGVGLAGEVARGAGVDLSVGSLVARNVASHKTATDITNSGYVEGAAGSVGTRQDPAKVLTAAKEAADAAAIGEEKALSGMQKFVGKSTDLATGMEIVKEMSVLAKSGAGDLDDYMDAAGDVALKLGDIPNKGQAVVAVMKTMARQGQLGASEMRSFAKNVAPLIATAGMFAGGPAKAMSELGATFQVTKQFGGAKGPAQAATAVTNFVSDLKSQSGLKALHGAGMKDTDIFADKGRTQMRALSEIVPRMLELTKGDLTKVAAEMKGKQSGRVLTGFQKVFADAGGGAAGKAAVAGKFGEFGGEMSDKQIQESLARAMGETEAKAQLFQNRLQAIADENLPRVMDALEKLAPLATSAAEGFAKFVAWAAENPFQAVAGALAASVAKAGLGSALEAGLAKALGSSAGLSITAASATVVGAALIYLTVQREKKAGAEDVFSDVGAAAKDIDAARAEKKKGGISPETRARLERERETLASDLALGAQPVTAGERLQAVNPLSDTTLKGLGRHEGATDVNFQADAATRMKEIDDLLGKAADGHTKAAGVLTKAGQVLIEAASAWKPVGGFGPGATTGPAPVR